MQCSQTIELFGKTLSIKRNKCITSEEQQGESKKALTLYIHINKKCNARCQFCNIYKETAPTVEFDLKKLQEVLEELVSKRRLGRIAITGGETFLDIKLLDNILQIIKQTVVDPIVTINTNASLIWQLDKLENANILTEVRISRHHYQDEVNNQIFGIQCATLKEIAEMVKKYGSEYIKLNCNLIKGHIDSCQEIKRYLDEVSKAGVSEVGFVGLMPFNEYCKKHHVNYSSFEFTSDFLWGNRQTDLDICQCDNFLYFSSSGQLVSIYFRQVKTLKCSYSRQFVYSYDNHFTAGFGEQIIY